MSVETNQSKLILISRHHATRNWRQEALNYEYELFSGKYILRH